MITIIVLYILLGIIAFIVILLHFSVRVKLSAASGEKPNIEIKWLFVTIYPRKPKEKKKKKRSDDKTQPKVEYTEDEIEDLIKQAEQEDLQQELITEADMQSPETGTAEDTVEYEEFHQDEEVQTENIENISEVKRKPDRKAKKEMKKKAKAEKAAAKAEKKSGGGLDKIKRYVNMVKPYVPMAWKAFKKILKSIRFTKLDIRLVSGKEDAYDAAMAYGKLNAAVYNGVAAIGRIFTVQAKSVRVDCRFNEKAFEYDVSTTVMVRPSTLIAIVFCVGVNFLRIFLPQKFRAWKERRRIKRMNKKAQKYNETELLTNE